MDGCIEWGGTRSSQGYGIAKRKEKAHRKAWREAFGPIPYGMQVCHRCDNPPCVNPDHLFLGTHADNMRDKREKGRCYRPSGELNHAAILTKAQAIAIISDKRRYPVIAKEYGVTSSNIASIKYGKSWPDLDRGNVALSEHVKKVTPEQVVSIRNDPRTSKKVAEDYGLTERAVIKIRKRLSYKYIP